MAAAMSRLWSAASNGCGGYSGDAKVFDEVRVNEERKIEIEEVDAVASPPKARVADAPDAASSFERKRDYLEGFLSRQEPESQPEGPGGDLYEAVIEALKDIYDPEIPVNIYDL